MTLKRGTAYKPFFFLGSLDAAWGGVIWLLDLLQTGLVAEGSAVVWHRNELLFGAIPAIAAGFLLTALPRWTRRPPTPKPVVGLLALAWVLARTVAFVSEEAGLFASGCFILLIVCVTGWNVIAGRDRRNFKVVPLLGLLCGAACLTARENWEQFGLRLGVACLVALMMIIGGRVIPALTSAFLEGPERSTSVPASSRLETGVGVLAVLALSAWVVSPLTVASGLLSVGAGLAQLLRLSQWRSAQVRHVGHLMILHVGYAWIPVGFLLSGLDVVTGSYALQAAGVHAWTLGGMGGLGIGVMASMTRKHAGHPFSNSHLANAAFAAVVLSCVARLAQDVVWVSGINWITLSALLWTASFVLFLAAFGSDLAPSRGPA